MGKNCSDNLHSIKNTGNNLTLKQMFDMSEKLMVGQSDGIFGVTPINWEDSSWKHLSLDNDEEVISLSHAKVYVFSDSVLCRYWYGLKHRRRIGPFSKSGSFLNKVNDRLRKMLNRSPEDSMQDIDKRSMIW